MRIIEVISGTVHEVAVESKARNLGIVWLDFSGDESCTHALVVSCHTENGATWTLTRYMAEVMFNDNDWHASLVANLVEKLFDFLKKNSDNAS